MSRRVEIEEKWRAKELELERYAKELKNWKKTVLVQLEEQRAKNFDQIVAMKKSTAAENMQLKALLAKKDQQIRIKDDEVYFTHRDSLLD